ncbi:hypothetical protein LCGC14_1378760 [marine sediment metagenome]|uniref:Uncharacterized protein n=2 Tax=root TaxID=1 RepID=A0A831QUP0_9FLAO|nr:hypothetical protein [Pricia antarctica]
MEKIILISIKLILSLLFVGCLLSWPYSYFELVRFIGMIGFGVLAYDIREKDKFWFVLWLSSATLVNPFFKIALGRELWNVIDVIWAILLISSIFLRRKPINYYNKQGSV